MPLIVHSGYSFKFLKQVLILLFIVFALSDATAKTVRIGYMGEINSKHKNGKAIIDTAERIVLFSSELEWDVKIINEKGNIREIITERPDTLAFSEPVTVKLTTDFVIVPELLTGIYALHYKIVGSTEIKLNGRLILGTGIYARPKAGSKAGNTASLFQDEYVNFIFKDSSEKFEITYKPHPKSHTLDLQASIGGIDWANEKVHDRTIEANKSFAQGFYFLAFGIIFIILFLYYREKAENIYFSLFCFFASMAFLWQNMKIGIFDDAPGIIVVLMFAAISFEFLSIFFAKVLRNSEKSKIPLAIMAVTALISFDPRIRYFSATSINLSQQTNPYIVVAFIVTVFLLMYTLGSCLYYLIRGFGQKRWEAKTITIMCTINLVVTFLLPAFVSSSFIFEMKSTSPVLESVLDNLTEIGLCIYPLSVALVLGRRNGENQKQLVSQIKSIERLSEENLEKEKEKKQILEDLNSQLELKVYERTLEVMQQKEVIELKNKAITDNINYAQRIQSAILPDVQLIFKTLNDAFILFLPKDIVSGDFYAFAEKNERVIVVAGDCTGHGVSGAFMSMIASSLLNQIINERGVVEPDQILNQLNISIIETLRQSENESNDGMDISICSFDLNRKELHFAGANRPLWLLRNNQMQVFAPNKFPIGGLQMARERVFTKHIASLQKDDAVYIFTDGYADQFGGPNGKKLMTGKFRDMLLGIQHKNMKEQGAHLKHFFESWRGTNEQVDDVLVIGVRV